jgi:hypothetical protein
MRGLDAPVCLAECRFDVPSGDDIDGLNAKQSIRRVMDSMTSLETPAAFFGSRYNRERDDKGPARLSQPALC